MDRQFGRSAKVAPSNHVSEFGGNIQTIMKDLHDTATHHRSAETMLQSSTRAIWSLYRHASFPNLRYGAFSNAQCGNHREWMCRADRRDLHGASEPQAPRLGRP